MTNETTAFDREFTPLSVDEKNRLNTVLRVTFTAASGIINAKQSLERYFEGRNYVLVRAAEMGMLRYYRKAGLGPEPSLCPSSTDAIAEIILRTNAAGLEVSCKINLKSVAGFPWERRYWDKEMRGLETSVRTGMIVPPQSRWTDVTMITLSSLALMSTVVVLAPSFGVIIWVTFIVVERLSGLSTDSSAWIAIPVSFTLAAVGALFLTRWVKRRTYGW